MKDEYLGVERECAKVVNVVEGVEEGGWSGGVGKGLWAGGGGGREVIDSVVSDGDLNFPPLSNQEMCVCECTCKCMCGCVCGCVYGCVCGCVYGCMCVVCYLHGWRQGWKEGCLQQRV